ncbi:hypothetical protein SAMN04488103_105265 [Gemmobacter aquatilis]|uniref:Uncharacterized protein n=1 Tax=Gemmobacter aquatilis TaxID=933059 RepID=A0A1H8H712_9RHOB|nr:hypothetical protein [Gemmobacter aquatilis]SEN51789.1 hypothetical protein SAMN04488103_105265 [Gemmobacter aquatilis]
MTSAIRDHLSQALAELRASHAAQGRAIAALETALEQAVQQGIYALPETAAPISAHRREHRPGPPPKIAGDPELQAFITARVDRLTFAEIAAEVAQNFPANRRVGKSAIHEWWRKSRSGNRPVKP